MKRWFVDAIDRALWAVWLLFHPTFEYHFSRANDLERLRIYEEDPGFSRFRRSVWKLCSWILPCLRDMLDEWSGPDCRFIAAAFFLMAIALGFIVGLFTALFGGPLWAIAFEVVGVYFLAGFLWFKVQEL